MEKIFSCREKLKKIARKMARDAVTGRIVSQSYADKNPKTTVNETIKKVKPYCLKNEKKTDRSIKKVKNKYRKVTAPLPIHLKLKLLRNTFNFRDNAIKITQSSMFLGDIDHLWRQKA